MKWQPANTAPKDGTPIIAHINNTDYVTVVAYIGDEEIWKDATEDYIPDSWLTHWMPLPELPESDALIETSQPSGAAQSLIQKFEAALSDAELGITVTGSHRLHAVRDTWKEAITLLRQHESDTESSDHAKLIEALTPSGATKAAYIGEFSISVPLLNEEGEEYMRSFNVPWTTIKEIMAAIMKRATKKMQNNKETH